MCLLGYFHLWSMIVMGSELLRVCPIYIYTVNTVSTFSDALCGSFPTPLCCLNMNGFNQKNNYSLWEFICTFQVLSVFQFVCALWSIFILYVCRIVFTGMNWCFIFFFSLCLNFSVYCTFTLFYMQYLFILVVNNAAFLRLLGLFVVEAGWDESCVKRSAHTQKAIISYIVAFWGTLLLKSACDECPV